MTDPGKSLLDTKELLSLIDCANQLNLKTDLNELLTHILVLTGQLLGSLAGSIMLHDVERRDLYFAAATGPAQNEIKYMRVPIDKGKSGQVFATGEPLIENNLSDHYSAVDNQAHFTTKSMICVPLKHEDKIFGVMQILNKADGKESFNDRDLELVSRFAVQVSIAIRNAILIEQMLSSSGLYALPEVRNDIIDRTTATGIPAVKEKLSILFVDMRNFRQLCRDVDSAEDIQEMLSEFLSMLSNKVIENQGIVNKFLGDGLMAIFRTDAGARYAVHAAFAMLDGFKDLLSHWDESSNVDLGFLDIGIGIATDHVILGSVGNDKIRDFTAVGKGVNLAAAMERAARDGLNILCDNLTLRSVREIIMEYEGPISADKADKMMGGVGGYKIFNLKSLKKEGEKIVFMSYSTKDKDWVEKHLTIPLRKNQVDVFFSKDTISPADKWQKTIGEGLNNCNWFIIVISQNSVRSEWVEEELMYALDRNALKGRIVPVIMDDTSPNEVSWRLKSIQWVDMSGNDPDALQKILDLIQDGGS